MDAETQKVLASGSPKASSLDEQKLLAIMGAAPKKKFTDSMRGFGKALGNPYRKSWYSAKETCHLELRGFAKDAKPDIHCKAKITMKTMSVISVFTFIGLSILLLIDFLYGIIPTWEVSANIAWISTLFILPLLVIMLIANRTASRPEHENRGKKALIIGLAVFIAWAIFQIVIHSLL